MERAGGSGPRKVCMNVKCGTSSSNSWKPGWSVQSGRTCELCEHCGLVFEQGRFCETFHSDDAGWRTCNTCKKRVHCGCIVSLYSFVLLDAGGVECQACAKKSTPGLPLKHVPHVVPSSLAPQRLVESIPARGWGESFGPRVTRNVESSMSWQPYNSTWYPPKTSGFPVVRQLPEAEQAAEGKVAEPIAKGRVGRTDELQPDPRFVPGAKDSNSSEHIGGDSTDGEQHVGESSPTGFSRDGAGGVPDNGHGDYDGDSMQGVTGATPVVMSGVEDEVANLDSAAAESSRRLTGKSLFTMEELIVPGPPTGLSMSIGITDNSQQGVLSGSPVGIISTVADSSGVSGESRDLVSKLNVLNPYRSRHRQLLPRAFHASTPSTPNTSTDTKANETASVRVARPPGQGRGRNQLLPRYWPRITDQELQQITSGDSNATITPLFEKMLSASDAGRIGRLVLPKACAEAYFPAISQPEGLPMKIQDITGKEWVFQFRFWPNNNSRMYVLEGVTPCIQSMQLQAGDTVTFSRLDPEGKLVMGYRRAPASLSAQDPKSATRGTSPNISKGLNVGSLDGLYASTGGSLLSVNANAEAKNKSGQNDVSDSGYGWSKAEKAFGKEGSMLEALSQVDRKRGRPLGGKSKRLRLENEDSLELKTNWEEAQELLRPPPSIIPSVVTIEGHEFEEYEEPPIISKRTIFTSRQSGEQDQWAQCDECGSWRRVPPDGVVPARWTCSDNEWDRKRASCSAPQEISSDDVDHLLGLLPGEEVGIPEKTDGPVAGTAPMDSSGGLDALANAAALGETVPASTSPSSPARTTKHPRHRPGCTCIVCIQPPSGKGPKHKQNCLCNVCVTVKRRFKTLMLRRKKRLSEREAESFIRRKRKDEVEVSSGSKIITEAGSRNECSGGTTVVEGPRKLDPVSTDLSDIPGLAAFGLVYSGSKSGDDLPVSKGQIDLNSQPEREEEPAKVLGKISMRQLLQDASLPLDTYLKQHGIKSLFGSSGGDDIGPVGHDGVSSEKKSDEQSSSQCHDQSNEEASETSGRAHGDRPVSNQAGAQNPVQIQHLMKLAQSSLLCKYKSPETVSSTMLWSLGLRRTTI